MRGPFPHLDGKVHLTNKIVLPPGFVLGVATSAYQIEGASSDDGKGPSIWDTFTSTPGNVIGGVPGDRGVDHYHRFREDIAMMADLGIDSYRFSLSWPRLLPSGTGAINAAGIDFYSRLIDTLLDAGISPNVTLYHWDLAQVLEDRGGWTNRDVVDWFADYARVAFDAFGDRVPRWVTLNEPISIWVGYGMGLYAPGRRDPRAARQAMHHGLVAHGQAVQAFRESGHKGEIGVVVDIWQRHPATDLEADRQIAERDEDHSFRFFLNPLLRNGYGERLTQRLEADGTMPIIEDGDFDVIATPVDFIGLNVYSRVVVSAADYQPAWWIPATRRPECSYLDNGMEYYPKAAYDAIQLVQTEYGFDRPIYITENGMADGPNAADPLQDDERIAYVSGFLEWISRAIGEGADVRGYYLWSLMDNYEWASGYSQKFGIVHVDTSTMERTLKASAHWYRDLIAGRG